MRGRICEEVLQACFVALVVVFGSVSPSAGAPSLQEGVPDSTQEDEETEVVEEPIAPVPPEVGRRIVTLPTRPDVTLKVVLVEPSAPPIGALILFPGGNGAGHFSERGDQIRLGNNFLVRSAERFAEQGFLAAIVDVPSDHAEGMSDQFRTSPEHVDDVRAVVDFLADGWGVPLFLVGTSRGTLSAAHLGIGLQDRPIQGVILTASLAARRPQPPNITLPLLPLEQIRVPVLFVHHSDDGCPSTLYGPAQALVPRVRGSPQVDFVTVFGGDPPLSDPCEALSFHGFLGREQEVVLAIADWAGGRPVPLFIGA